MDNLSILYHLIEDRCWPSVNARALKHPEECSTWVTKKDCDSGDTLKLLPLHAAILLGAPEETVGQILMCYQEASKCKDHTNHLPLHLALLNGSGVGVVSLLILSYPESVNVKDPNGNLPIDIAQMSSVEHKQEYVVALSCPPEESCPKDLISIDSVANENPTALFRLLIEKQWVAALDRIANHPEEVATWVFGEKDGNKEKLLPIHAAVSLGAPEHVICNLLVVFPDGARLVDDRGYLPLHRAVQAEAEIGVIVELLVRYPLGLTATDNTGKSPFENASTISGTYRRVYQWAMEWSPEYESNENAEFLLNEYDSVKHRLSVPPPFETDQLPEVSLVLSGSPKSSTSFKPDLSSGDDSLYNMIKKAEWAQVSDHIKENPDSCHKWMMKLYDNAQLAWRLLPIHAAVIYGAPEKVVRELLLIYRDGAKCQDDAGLLPLHLALKVGGSVGVVTLLILAYRDSVFVRDNKGKLPMDIARNSSAAHKDGYLFALLWAWSRSSSIYLSHPVESTPHLQATKLFSLIHSRRWLEAMSWMKEFPNECKIPVTFRDDSGNIQANQLPLHVAVFVGAKEDFIRVMLRIHPEGARFSDGSGMLPLHIALERNSGVGVVMILAMAYPKGIFTKDDLCRLPMDIADSSTSSYRSVYIWFLKCLSMKRIVSDETLSTPASTPLRTSEHHPLESSFEQLCTTEAVRKMIHTKSLLKIEDYPSSTLVSLLHQKKWASAKKWALNYPKECATWVTKKCDRGDTLKLLPLHAAILLGAPEETVGQILMCYQEASKCKDHTNHLPLHLALLNASGIGVVSLLILSYPESVNVQDPNGNLPMDIARMSPAKHKQEYVFALSCPPEESCPKDLARMVRTTYENPTALFCLLIEKQWVDALDRIATHPDEVAAWVFGEKDGNKEKLLPIHAAVSLGAPEELVRSIIMNHPESTRMVDDKGYLPLHRALMAEADIGVVVELVMRFPMGLDVKDNIGRIPADTASTISGIYRRVYQWAMEWSPQYESSETRMQINEKYDEVKYDISFNPTSDVDLEWPEVSLVLRGSPTYLLAPNLSSGDISLYEMIKKAEWAQVSNHIKENPDSCRKWMMKLDDKDEIMWRLLPIHAAVIYGAPEKVVRELLLIYREGAKCQDDAGLLPLHLALNVGCSIGVVSLLILAFRDSVFVRDNKGKLPMEIVRKSSAAHKDGYLFALLWALSQSSLLYSDPCVPDTTLVYDSTFFCPLDIPSKLIDLISLRRWPEAMARLREYPEECRTASSWCDGKGNFLTRIFPIHAAALLGATEDFVRVLLREYPEGAHLPDCKKSLPLHLALVSNCTVGTISVLLMANPCAVYVRDSRGLLPIDIAELSSSPYKSAYIWALKFLPAPQDGSGNRTKNSVNISHSSHVIEYCHDETITNEGKCNTAVDVGKENRAVEMSNNNTAAVDTGNHRDAVDASHSFDVDDSTLEDYDAANSIVDESFDDSLDSSTESCQSSVTQGANNLKPMSNDNVMVHKDRDGSQSPSFIGSLHKFAMFNYCSGYIDDNSFDLSLEEKQLLTIPSTK